MSEKIEVTLSQMNFILLAMELGFKMAEKGANLEATLLSAYDTFEVKKPGDST